MKESSDSLEQSKLSESSTSQEISDSKELKQTKNQQRNLQRRVTNAAGLLLKRDKLFQDQFELTIDLIKTPYLTEKDVDLNQLPRIDLPLIEQAKYFMIKQYNKEQNKELLTEESLEIFLRHIINTLIKPQRTVEVQTMFRMSDMVKLQEEVTLMKQELNEANNASMLLRLELQQKQKSMKEEKKKMTKLIEDAEQVRTDLQSELRSYQRMKAQFQTQKEQFENLKLKYQQKLNQQEQSIDNSDTVSDIDSSHQSVTDSADSAMNTSSQLSSHQTKGIQKSPTIRLAVDFESKIDQIVESQAAKITKLIIYGKSVSPSQGYHEQGRDVGSASNRELENFSLGHQTPRNELASNFSASQFSEQGHGLQGSSKLWQKIYKMSQKHQIEYQNEHNQF